MTPPNDSPPRSRAHVEVRVRRMRAALAELRGVAVVLSVGQLLVTYALAVVLSMLTCWLMNVASAARLAGVTATIILLVPHPGTAQEMMSARVLEVGWGVSVAVSVVWLVTRVERRRHP